MVEVSVCMITYNHEKYIDRAIQGVLEQDCEYKIELVISNDASTDTTHYRILEAIRGNSSKIKIRYINNSENIGMMANFIQAIKECKGRYIALCEGDDYWIDSYKLQKQVDFLEANTNYAVSFHKVKILKGDKLFRDSVIEERYENIKKYPATVFDLLKHGNFMHTASVVFRNNIRHFPMEFKYSPVGDYFLHIINSQYGDIHRINEVMGVYREGVGIYSTLSPEKMTNKIILYNSCILSYLTHPEQREALLRKQLAIVSGLRIFPNRENLSIEGLHNQLSFKNILELLIMKIKNKFTF